MRIKLYQPYSIYEVGARSGQEDFILPLEGKATADNRLFIVCDGMGGHEHGEVASSTVATALDEYFGEHFDCNEPLPDEAVTQALDYAYTKLDAADDGNYKKMGTTLTMLCFHKAGVTAAHIGDSRIYHVRPGKGLIYVSRDHSLVFDLYRSGEITYDEIKTHPNKNIITRAVQPGIENRVKPDIVHITDIEPGDYFYLCSDGMLEQMDDDELYRLLSAPMSDDKKRQRLLDVSRDAHDNHSAYLLHVDEVSHELGDPSSEDGDENTSTYNALNMKLVDQVETTDSETATPPASDPQTPPTETDQQPLPLSQRPALGWGLFKWLILMFIAAVLAAGAYFYTSRSHSKDKPLVERDKKDSEGVASGIKPVPSPQTGDDTTVSVAPIKPVTHPD